MIPFYRQQGAQRRSVLCEAPAESTGELFCRLRRFSLCGVRVSRIVCALATDKTESQLVQPQQVFPRFTRFPWTSKRALTVLTVLGTQVLQIRLGGERLARTRANVRPRIVRSADVAMLLQCGSTDRDQEIVSWVAKGLTNRQISQRMGITEHGP